MATITIKIMTHDRNRCAEVTLPDSLTVGALVFECQKRWQFDRTEVFALRDMGRNLRLTEEQSLSTAGVCTGAELQIFPLVEGGVR
jgi:WXG100 protein secretion system (Wss), protein YukD